MYKKTMIYQDNFFIKKGYVCNNNALTYETENIGTFWTDKRLKTSSKFQYHVYLLAAKLAKSNQFKKVIDLGCGPATKTKNILAPITNEIILIDQPNCEALTKRIFPEARFISTNLEKCDIKWSYSADLIVCADVIEHLFDPMPCLKFAIDHLSPSGIAVFSTPERDILRGKDCMTSPHSAHVREWNRSEFKQLLEYSGFKVVKHSLVPAAKMPFYEEILWRSTKYLFAPSHWRSCQVAICKKA